MAAVLCVGMIVSPSRQNEAVPSIDFFAVISRKPTICDFKPVQVEVAVARLEDKSIEADSSVQVLRFANRVPLQFDKFALEGQPEVPDHDLPVAPPEPATVPLTSRG